MRRILSILLISLLIFFTLPLSLATADGEIDLVDSASESAVLMEQSSGKILYSHQMDVKRYPASTTKILTALVALENGKLKEMVTVGNEIDLIGKDSSKAGLKKGQKLSLEDLIRGLMLPSGNDAAYSIAVYIGRKDKGDDNLPVPQAVKAFTDLMNQKAKEVGAKHSHFANPDGYHDENHYTTAYDLAVISRAAMEQAFFRDLVRIASSPAKGVGSPARDGSKKGAITTWVNSNRLIQKADKKHYYPYATGIKTGHTSPAGHCLVSSAEKDRVSVVAVVLNGSDEGRWIDSKAILDYGLTQFEWIPLAREGETVDTVQVQDHARNDSGELEAAAADDIREILKKEDIGRVEKRVQWIDESLNAPVAKGQVLGKVRYVLDGKDLGEVELIASRDIAKKSLISNVIPGNQKTATPETGAERQAILKYWPLILVLILLLLLFLSRRSSSRKKKHRRRSR